MDPVEEKKADLFADVLEYREALVLLKDYGIGFNVTIDRYWHGDEVIPYYKVAITKLHPEKGHAPLWSAVTSDESFLKAVRYAVRAAELEVAAYYEKLRAGPGSVATGQQGAHVWPTGPGLPTYMQATLDEELKKAGLTPGVPCRPAEEGS